MSIQFFCQPLLRGAALAVAVGLLVFTNPAPAEAGSFSESWLTRNIKHVVREVEHAGTKDSDVNLYEFDSYMRIENRIAEARPDEVAEILRLLTKLDSRYGDNDAYLHVSSWLIAASLPLPEPPSNEETAALMEFLDRIVQNHGNVGKMQKMRIMNFMATDYPSLEAEFHEHLDTEELLNFRTSSVAWEYLTQFPGSDEYNVLGGDVLGPIFDEVSLEKVDDIARLLPLAEGEDRFSWAEDIAAIDRYQYFRYEEAAQKSVERAREKIAEEREVWSDYEFINDTVLYGATAGEEDRFMDARELARLEELSEDVQVFAAEDGREAADARAQFLEAIETTEGPITAVLHMHGNDEVAAFQDASQDDTAELFADELAEAFARRYERFPKMDGTDVLILETCSAGTYGIFFLEVLVDAESPLPIVIAAGEAGQVTLSAEDGGSEFASYYLFTGNQTLGDLYDNHLLDIGSNPLILVPDSSDPYLPVQVS